MPQLSKATLEASLPAQHDNEDDIVEPGAEQDLTSSNGEEYDSGEETTLLKPSTKAHHSVKRKRKSKSDDEEIEDVYMRRLAREEAKEAAVAAAERAAKRRKVLETSNGVGEEDEDEGGELEAASEDYFDENEREDAADDEMSPPPRHETEQAADVELAKANRTVFLGNVSTAAISSKAARKVLIDHLKSIFKSLPQPKDGEPKHGIESIRFRSTPYATAIPKKASFARKEVMDATTKSTNAYAVYSSPLLAREATNQLNGTVVLDRHLRVDSVAHPAPVDHKRCIFVGNLGFVDDESNIQAANEEEGREKRKRTKQPGDVEEGLWRTFGKCGTVESVRVIRDSTTRVGKGIAYVQFDDGNAVEAALLYDGRKFPPMLPRKLRVSRAKAPKRNATAGSGRPAASGYQRKVSGEEATKAGRARKLLERGTAAQQRGQPGREGMRKRDSNKDRVANGVKRPEAFVFEGHRASSKAGKGGLKLGKKKGGKPTTRSARRGAAYKAGKKKQ